MIRLATRGSPLARWQAEHIGSLLAEPYELVIVETEGDRRRDTPISAMGGRGVFVKEVQAAVLDGRADAAVHSAKDLPSSSSPSGLVLAAVPAREDASDVLVGARLDDLPAGALVATGAPRRKAQLAWRRPDLTFTSLRGNINTRIERVPPGGAMVTALAALRRLGLEGRASEVLDPLVMVPQVGQGALAVECREDDERTRAALGAVEHSPSRRAVDAERAFLRTLGGGCDAPLGAHAVAGEDIGVRLTAVVATPDGSRLVRRSDGGDDPETVGRRVAEAFPAALVASFAER